MVLSDMRRAYELGVDASPTIVVGDYYPPLIPQLSQVDFPAIKLCIALLKRYITELRVFCYAFAHLRIMSESISVIESIEEKHKASINAPSVLR